MRNDALTAQLEAAIEEAQRLNKQAGAALEQAIKAAVRDADIDTDYRYKAANKMLGVYIRAHNVAAQYQLAKGRMAKKKFRR